MKAASLATVVALALLAPQVRADDTVRVCIAASTEGQTQRQQGKLLAARDQMIACARDACPAVVRSHCARWLKEIEAAIPSVVVRAVDATGADVIGARLTIDARPARLDGQPVRLDPGPHTVAVEADGGARKEEHVLLLEGEASRRVIVRLPATGSAASPSASAGSSTSPSSSRVPLGAWILGGAGLVALGGATYFGLAAKSELDGLQSSCSPHCSDARTQPGRTDALVFDVLLGVGGAAVAGALVWALAFPSQGDAGGAAMQLDVHPLPGGGLASFGLRY
jgi:hypothetical protein